MKMTQLMMKTEVMKIEQIYYERHCYISNQLCFKDREVNQFRNIGSLLNIAVRSISVVYRFATEWKASKFTGSLISMVKIYEYIKQIQNYVITFDSYAFSIETIATTHSFCTHSVRPTNINVCTCICYTW